MALNPHGILMLGGSENDRKRFRIYFELTDKRPIKLYTKRQCHHSASFSTSRPAAFAPRPGQTRQAHAVCAPGLERRRFPDLQSEADRAGNWRRTDPRGVIVNDELDVLQFRGKDQSLPGAVAGERPA